MRLRSNFSHRYKHRRLKLLQTGVAPEELPKPSSAHYEDLEFLTEVIDFTQKHEDLKPPAELVSFNSSLRSALIKEVEKYPTIWKSDQSTKQSDEYWNMVSKTMAIPKEQLRKQWGRLRNYCLRLIHLEQHPKVRKRRRVFPPWEHWTEMTFFRDFVKKESPKSLSKTIRKQNLDDEPTASTSAEPDHKEANSTTIRKSIRIAKKKSRSYAADSNGSDNESFSLEGADPVQETHSNNGEFICSLEEPISTEISSEFSSRPQPVTPKSKKRVSARSTICKGFSLADRQKLIEYVKESEVIWNEDYDDARRSRLVGAAWRAIGQMLDKSALDCRNQWWRLRATFKGRLKLYETKKNSESNSNSSPAAEPKWVHWKEMQFIRHHWCKTIQSIEELPSDSRQTAVLCHSCGVYVDGASDSEPLVHILKKHFQKPQYRCQHCDFVAKQTFAEMQKHIYSTHVEHYEPSGDRTKPALLQAALTEVQHTCFPDYPLILQLSSARSAIISLMSTMLKSAESKKIIHRNVPMD
uniref:MADF domain-containing protein n=1 Tax=Plectus sambesii TaxID=2011161 RepID=A0A914V8I7_9BILA